MSDLNLYCSKCCKFKDWCTCNKKETTTTTTTTTTMIDKNKKYKTRDGKDVKIYTTNGGNLYPVHGAYYTDKGDWQVCCWKIDGKYSPLTNELDLIPQTTKYLIEVDGDVRLHDIEVVGVENIYNYVDYSQGAGISYYQNQSPTFSKNKTKLNVISFKKVD